MCLLSDRNGRNVRTVFESLKFLPFLGIATSGCQTEVTFAQVEQKGILFDDSHSGCDTIRWCKDLFGRNGLCGPEISVGLACGSLRGPEASRGRGCQNGGHNKPRYSGAQTDQH